MNLWLYDKKGGNKMAKNQKQPMDQNGTYKDGTQKTEDGRKAPSEKKKKINECI
jgi:hypothetical protein